VYVLSNITLRPDPAEIIIIVLAGLALVLLATAYPAFSAAKVKPWENLARL
jgi:ABC-type lipoprotein release transport system permease subunit